MASILRAFKTENHNQRNSMWIPNFSGLRTAPDGPYNFSAGSHVTITYDYNIITELWKNCECEWMNETHTHIRYIRAKTPFSTCLYRSDSITYWPSISRFAACLHIRVYHVTYWISPESIYSICTRCPPVATNPVEIVTNRIVYFHMHALSI